MGFSVNISGPGVAQTDRHDHVREERRAEVKQGEQELADSFRTGQRSATDHRRNLATRSEAAARNAADLARLTRMGQQEPARAAHAADTPHPEQADPTSQTQKPTQTENAAQEVQPSEQPTPTQEAAAPEPQTPLAQQENLPDHQTAGLPAGDHQAPTAPNAPREAGQAQQADNHAQPQQGEGDSHAGNNPQAQRTASRTSTARRDATATTHTSPDAEAHLTPEQQQQLRYARLQGGGQVGTPRTPVASNTPEAILAQSTTTAPAPMPETPAQQAPLRSVQIYCTGTLPEDQAPAYQYGLECACNLNQMEQPRQQGPQASPMSAAVFQAATPAMTREQMLMARVNRDRDRREGEERSVGGLPRRGDSDLGLRYQLGVRRDMGAA